MSDTYTPPNEEVLLRPEGKHRATTHDPELLSLDTVKLILNSAALDVVIEDSARGARRAANDYKRLYMLLGGAEKRGNADVSLLKSLMDR